MRLEQRGDTPPLVLLITPVVAILLSLLLCAGFIVVAGAPVIGA